MSPDPLLPRPVRIFARLRRAGFDAECPGCGTLVSIRPIVKPMGRDRGGNAESRSFNEMTGAWTCRKCHRRYLLGIVFHPIDTRRGAKGPPTWIAPDMVPTVEQAHTLRASEARRMAELRELSPSFLAGSGPGGTGVGARGARKHKRGDAVNVGPKCTCPEDWQGRPSQKYRDPQCPRHGGGAGGAEGEREGEGEPNG